MATQHVFLSYIREDTERMNQLERALESAGFTVWRDTNDLWPGDNWELKIREAISSSSLVFLACFSSALGGRDVSYQYKELMIAAEEYKVRPLDTSWLMTVRFDECVIPAVDLGGGRSLNKTIHRTDLFGNDEMPNLAKLVTAIHRVIDSTPAPAASSVNSAVAETKSVTSAAGTSMAQLRELIRHPELEMDFDEFVMKWRGPLITVLRDRDRFPTSLRSGTITETVARDWVARIRDYDNLVAPLLPQLRLLGMYGQEGHLATLSKALTAVAQECYQESGSDLLRRAHAYPAALITYSVSLGALLKNNYRMLKAVTENVLIRQIGGSQHSFVTLAGPRTIAGDWRWLGTLLEKTQKDGGFDTEFFNSAHSGRIGMPYTPISDHLFNTLNPVFGDDFTNDEDYADAFDKLEVFFDAIGEHERATNEFWGGRTVYGRYTWRHQHSRIPPEVSLQQELEKAQKGWTPLLAGLFEGSVDAATTALSNVHATASRARDQRW